MSQKVRTDVSNDSPGFHDRPDNEVRGVGTTNLFGPLRLRQVRELVDRTRDWPEESVVDLNNTDGGSTLLVCRPEPRSPTQGLETTPERQPQASVDGKAGVPTAESGLNPLTDERLRQLRDDENICTNAGERSMAAELLELRGDRKARLMISLGIGGAAARADRLEYERDAARTRVIELEAALQTSREMYTSARERAAGLSAPVRYVVVRTEQGDEPDVEFFDTAQAARTAEGIASGYAPPGVEYTAYALTDITEGRQ